MPYHQLSFISPVIHHFPATKPFSTISLTSLHPPFTLPKSNFNPNVSPPHSTLTPSTPSPAKPPPTPPPKDSKLTFYAAALTELLAAVVATLLCSLSDIPVLGKGWIFTPPHLLHAIAVAIPFSAIFWLVERAPTGIEAATDQSFRSFFGARAIWEVAFFCICVSFGEEFLFRSWLLVGLEKWSVPVGVALVGSSVIFGVLHAYTKVYMALASLAGLMFGGMFVASGESVLEPLVVHFLYDFMTILVMQRKWLAADGE